MATLCAGTPKISVRDNRGLDVRTLRYNRSAAGAVATQYVDAATHNALGQPASSQDPRFFGSSTLNFQNTPVLSGQILETVSADSGSSKACSDIAGQPIWQYSQGRDANLQSNKNITVQLSYDALGRPVQRACHTADVSGGASLDNTTDIWSYGDYSGPAGATYDPADTADPRNANQRGQVLQHFDTAGLIDMSILGYVVQSAPSRQDRRFLAVPCDSVSHWKPGPPKKLYDSNKGWLEPDTDAANLYATRWSYSALGQVLTQVDAKGHQQHTEFDCAGRKYAASVTPNGGTLTPVCTGITYTAAGAIDTRSDANNIRVAYVYEPQATQRLLSIAATRASTQLQALTYAYDGVGNVTTLSDNSAGAQVRFFRNRAVTADRGYTYDALYQLTSASGRENYVDTTPKGTDWPNGQFNPVSTPDYQAYTRAYTYDAGGNLTDISSSNWSGGKRTMVVSSKSNRAVSTANNAGATQANIDTYFDLAGKSICLDANRNQPMYWTAFHQLYCVVTTYRAPTPGAVTGEWSNCDREQYAYDSEGQRVRKYASSMAGGSWNSLDTRYLPGLEMRGNSASGENLEVIVLDDGARILNWAGSAGKPGDIPNLQLRYQYSDRQNSCQIETDSDGNVITQEEYYPYGGTAVLTSRSNSEVKYKYIRYSGKERDATGLYYYGMRYYQPWIGRWINPDPAGTVDGQNLYCMVGNNPTTAYDATGLMRTGDKDDSPPDVSRLSIGESNPSSRPGSPESSEAQGNQEAQPSVRFNSASFNTLKEHHVRDMARAIVRKEREEKEQTGHVVAHAKAVENVMQDLAPAPANENVRQDVPTWGGAGSTGLVMPELTVLTDPREFVSARNNVFDFSLTKQHSAELKTPRAPDGAPTPPAMTPTGWGTKGAVKRVSRQAVLDNTPSPMSSETGSVGSTVGSFVSAASTASDSNISEEQKKLGPATNKKTRHARASLAKVIQDLIDKQDNSTAPPQSAERTRRGTTLILQGGDITALGPALSFYRAKTAMATAHERDTYSTGFINIPAAKSWEKKLQITLGSPKEGSGYRKNWKEYVGNRKEVIDHIKETYAKNDIGPLHPFIESRIDRLLDSENNKLEGSAWTPGYHAETIAFNHFLNTYYENTSNEEIQRLINERELGGRVYVLFTGGKNKITDFATCQACTPITMGAVVPGKKWPPRMRELITEMSNKLAAAFPSTSNAATRH